MWYNLGKWVLRNRLPLIIAVLLSTAVMTYFASKVERSYDFAKAIPVDHPKFLEYEAFKQKFGEDGSLLVIGFEKKDLFQLPFFQTFVELQQQIKQVAGVEDVLSVSAAVNLVKDSATEKLRTTTVFPENGLKGFPKEEALSTWLYCGLALHPCRIGPEFLLFYPDQ